MLLFFPGPWTENPLHCSLTSTGATPQPIHECLQPQLPVKELPRLQALPRGAQAASALPSPVNEDNELTSFEKMLWKFCLFPEQSVLLEQLTCLHRSPVSSVHGVVTQGTQLVTGDCAVMLSVVSACWFLFLWGV